MSAYLLRQSGWHNQGAALVDQLRLARCLVVAHLDYVAPLAGVEGHAALITRCDRVVEKLLCTIVGVRKGACGAALRADAGMWSYASRARMLQFRFFAKLSCDAPESTSYRALLLSRRMAPQTVIERKSLDLVGLAGASRWSFVKRCVCTAGLFPEPVVVDDIVGGATPLQVASTALRPVRALVMVRRHDPFRDEWRAVAEHTPDEPHQSLRLHSTSAVGAHSFDYATGVRVDAWVLPVTGTGIHEALEVWSKELQSAVFASLRRRANVFRAQHKSELPKCHAEWSMPRSAMRDFVCLQAGSRIGWWWHLDDAGAARRLQKARIGEWGDEFSFRRRVHKATQKTRLLKRLEEPLQRVCYLCKLRLPEHMAHLVCKCACASLVEWRERQRSALCALGEAVLEVDNCPQGAPRAPDFDDDCVLYTVMMGCTAVGKLGEAPLLSRPRTRRSPPRPDLELTESSMRPACAWLQWLTEHWLAGPEQQRRRAMSDPQLAIAAIGGRVARLVARASADLHAVRRRLLQDDEDFADRVLDPAALRGRAKSRPKS